MAFVARARHDEPVVTEKMGGVADLLGPRRDRPVIQFPESCGFDAQRRERLQIGEFERTPGPDANTVQQIDGFRRKHRRAIEVVIDFRPRAVRLERRIDDIERAGRVPAASRAIALQRIEALAQYSPHIAFEDLGSQRLQGIEEFDVPRLPVIGYRKAPESRRSIAASTSSVRSSWIRSIARAPLSSALREYSQMRASSAV